MFMKAPKHLRFVLSVHIRRAIMNSMLPISELRGFSLSNKSGKSLIDYKGVVR